MNISHIVRARMRLSRSLLSVSVHYRPTPDRKQQMKDGHSVQAEDPQLLLHDSKNEGQLSEKFQLYQDVFVKMLEKFKSIWDGHLRRVDISKRHVGSTSKVVPATYSASCQAGPVARNCSAVEIDSTLAEKVIESSAAVLASIITFAPKNDESLRFCEDYKNVNAVTTRDDYLLPRMDKCLASLSDATMFSTLDARNR